MSERIAGTETDCFIAICETARRYREQGEEVEVRFVRAERPGLPVYVLHRVQPQGEV